MKKFPLVVSYYTQNTPYEEEIQNLIVSLRRFHLESHIEPITSLGSWEKNCGYKPFFLLQKLEQFQRPLFWVDADAVFFKEPEPLSAFSSDIAVRMNKELGIEHPSYVMSGSIYINHTEEAKKILKKWALECIAQLSSPDRKEEMWDQMTLRDVICGQGCEGKVAALPPEYTMIVNHFNEVHLLQECVIGHSQASRRFKKIINNS